MTNQYISQVLREMALLLAMDDMAFKPRAYERAAINIAELDQDIEDIYKSGGLSALEDLPNIGKGIAAHIQALLERGDFPEYAALKKKVPVDVLGLTAVEGVGPKAVKALWKELGIKNLGDLERAVRAGKIRALPHFGEKSEHSILKSIEFLKSSGGRRHLDIVLREADEIARRVKTVHGVSHVIIAGSIRRGKETIGDIDVLVVAKNMESVMERFVALPEVVHVYARGKTKTLVRLACGLDVDLRAVSAKSFGAALNYFTGSKAHNVALRKLAIKKGWRLNEYGLYDKQKMIAGRTEQSVYKKLGLRYIPPELREMRGEIEAAQNNTLPQLIEDVDVKGDLQVQTDWTDGTHTIEEMARVAANAGLEYIAITDHTRSLAMTGGADEEKLLKQMAYIDALNKKGAAVRLLKGAEVNIGKNGELDIRDDVLAKLDIVGVAVHSHFKLSRGAQTKRVIEAMKNPHTDILFHPTGRLINRRPPIDIDMDAVITAAQKTNTILEINASPSRLDLKDDHIRKCVDAGVKMAINSDAHHKDHFAFLAYGVMQARRGWAQKKDIINTMSADGLLALLK